jgi:hypothetical protein
MHIPPRVQRIEVMVVTCRRGDGSVRSPERVVQMYYSMDGELLACYDPINGPPDYFYPAIPPPKDPA